MYDEIDRIYADVSPLAMSEKVRSMFAGIARRYDVMNSVITLGMHHSWRRRAVRLSEAQKGDQVLDCASGTGDLAIAFKEVVGQSGRVVATDFCQEMLDYIHPKIQARRMNLDVELADAMNLQYSDQSFDVVSIAYGIRNVDDPRVAIDEMVRVLRPGGRLVVLETGQPRGVMKFLYRLFRPVIPVAGRLIAGNSEAYTYLPATAAVFPSGSDFVDLLLGNPDVRTAQAYPLFFGVSYIYIASVVKEKTSNSK